MFFQELVSDNKHKPAIVTYCHEMNRALMEDGFFALLQNYDPGRIILLAHVCVSITVVAN